MNKIYQCQLIGTGTAGLSFIIALLNKISTASEVQRAGFQALFDSLIALEAAENSGGVLEQYQINANTDADEIVSCLQDGTPFTALRDFYLQQPETQQALISLPRVGELMLRPVANIIARLLGDRLVWNARVKRIVGSENGFESFDQHGQLLARSEKLVLCCGGREVMLAELSQWDHKTVLAGKLLRQKTATNLPNQSGDIVIVGSSHSGFSCAWRLLNDPVLCTYAEGRKIIILQRNPLVKLRCTPEFARQHQLAFDPADDVCPESGLVYRNAGLRKDAKSLYLKIKYGEEQRVQLHPIKQLSDAEGLFDQAAVIIQCTGFRANLPDIEINGISNTIKEKSRRGELREIESDAVIPGMYGFGLGIQIIPEGKYRGEKSFSGSSDGVLPYPHAIAPVIIDQLMQD